MSSDSLDPPISQMSRQSIPVPHSAALAVSEPGQRNDGSVNLEGSKKSSPQGGLQSWTHPLRKHIHHRPQTLPLDLSLHGHPRRGTRTAAPSVLGGANKTLGNPQQLALHRTSRETEAGDVSFIYPKPHSCEVTDAGMEPRRTLPPYLLARPFLGCQKEPRGPWAAQAVKHVTVGFCSGPDLRGHGIEPQRRACPGLFLSPPLLLSLYSSPRSHFSL